MDMSQLFQSGLPPDISVEAQNLAQRQEILKALLGRSLQPTEPFNYGRRASAISPLAPIAQVATAMMAGKGLRDTNAQGADLAARYNASIPQAMLLAEQARNGSPEVPGAPATGPTGNTSPSAATPAQAATPGNTTVSNAILMQHPATRALGMEMAKRNMEMQAFIDAAKKVQGTGTAAAGGTGAGGGGVPGAPAGFGGPAGGQPMEFWLNSDPTGKTYVEQLAKDYMETQKPVIDRGYGVGRIVNGKFVPDPASIDQIQKVEQLKANIAAGYKDPIVIHFSGGQDVQLSPFEAKAFYETGQLPARIQGQGAPGPTSNWVGKEPEGQFTGDLQSITEELGRIKDPVERAAAQRALQNQLGKVAPGATAPAAPAGLGTPGVTQSQPDLIRQAGDKAAAVQIGEGQGKEATAVFSDGAQAVQANRQLDNMSSLVTNFNPNRFQSLKSTFAAYLNGAGISEETTNKLLGTNVGDIRALTSQAVQLAGKLTRQTDAQPSQIQFLKNLQSMPNADMTAKGFAQVIAYMKDVNNYRIEKMIAQQQWLGSEPGIGGFEAAWAEKAKTLPFIWNQPQKATPGAPEVKAMPSAVPGAPPPPVGAKHVPRGNAPEGVDPEVWNYMTPEQKALWPK